MKSKLPIIVLLVLLIISGIVNFQFYSDRQNLIVENQSLEKEKARLSEENNSLSSKYRGVKDKYIISRKRLDDIQV